MIAVTRQLCVTACRKHRGFALVVTLSLMVLLTVVAVGLLTLSAVSLRTGSRDAAMSEARANARLALMLALGDLQKELGPDQRISAPGGQQLKEGDKSAGGQWTGVYGAWLAGNETRPSPAFRRWLISGDDSVVTNFSAAKSSSPSANKVPLVAADCGSRCGGSRTHQGFQGSLCLVGGRPEHESQAGRSGETGP